MRTEASPGGGLFRMHLPTTPEEQTDDFATGTMNLFRDTGPMQDVYEGTTSLSSSSAPVSCSHAPVSNCCSIYSPSLSGSVSLSKTEEKFVCGRFKHREPGSALQAERGLYRSEEKKGSLLSRTAYLSVHKVMVHLEMMSRGSSLCSAGKNPISQFPSGSADLTAGGPRSPG
ncbi:unnamed protein product [Pleuronectes platessa]|uniref:Uncharacterized protein n=1 Tax=Pleuronectes platessa TaxID=8262 RepID=A0A9N7Z359_PLEPL|nr:unnamed protein product [Pleuronectes platessa]